MIRDTFGRMQLVVTIFERDIDDAVRAIRALDRDHDMVEVRFDAFGSGDVEAFRDVTTKPVILTNRGGEPVEADFGLIDVEFGRKIQHRDRTVLSFHDFGGVPDLEPLIDAMLAERCAHTKIAVTPRDFADNERILAAIRPGLTIFGMGERGLYSRILAPFFGSELSFVAVDDEHAAAPAQVSLQSALAIYGDRNLPRSPKIFAIAGNPAGHSLSPTIHNPLFRKRGVAAAYTIASVASFDELIEPFTSKRIAGLSVTAPFKDAAYAFAERFAAPNALETRAVNTLVNTPGEILADNTDVDGFETLLRNIKGNRAAVLGAGGTGRAAVVALKRAGFEVTVYNRTPRKGTRPLDEIERFRGDVIVNTLPKGVMVNANATIDAAYTGPHGTGFALLQAQAIRQNELFLKAFS